MPSDRGNINYAKSVLRRLYAAAASISAGPLEVGKFYQIIDGKSGDSFLDVGASCDHDGIVFKATGTTPAAWAHGSRVLEIKLADLKAYSLQVFPKATSPVTITRTGFEGGDASGEISFPKPVLGMAIEEIIAEWDPDFIEPSPMPRRSLGIVVRTDGYGYGY